MADFRLFNKDCRGMSELEDNSIQCVVTSPPYWGLRKYAGEQDLVWGGDPFCRHEWIDYNARTYQQGQGMDELAKVWKTGGKPKAGDTELSDGDIHKLSHCSVCGAWRGAFGLEPTPEMYVQHTVEILREIRRVLRPDGVVFWNVGDSYAGSNCGSNDYRERTGLGSKPTDRYKGQKPGLPLGLKPKDLCLIPFRIAIVAQEDDWWVRSVIIWNKSNPMPESVNGWRWERHRIKIKKAARALNPKNEPSMEYDPRGRSNIQETWLAEWQDCPGCPKCSSNGGYVLRKGSWRPTDSYEQILMLTKSSSYYCDAEAVREAYTEPMNRWGGPELKRDTSKTKAYKDIQKIGYSSAFRVGRPMRPNENGRNLRNVWSFPTVPFPGAHFAVFPEKLPELCIKAATPEVGVCAKCGAPWARMVEKGFTAHNGKTKSKSDPTEKGNEGAYGRLALLRQAARERGFEYSNETKTLGWRPTCDCGCTDKVGATVLDPFSGAGTTLLVAVRLGRNAVGYELSSEYCELANKRINNVQIRYS